MRLVPKAVRARLRPLTARLRPPPEDPNTHPERLLVLPYVRGRTLEIGCGHRKTAASVIGVDLNPRGATGTVGNVAGHISDADVAADGAYLPFTSSVFDSVVARHNLEHYVDTAAVLMEWRRVLKSGGRLAVVVPDEEHYPGRTLDLDPTHYHGYSRAALARLVDLVGGFTDVETQTAMPNWSFMLTASRM